ncbi:MAG: ATP-grasp domain-containing protein [Candidatus Helarchaeales archaeon]
MPKVFIFEFFSGGGLSDREIPGSILSEGFAMLATALEEFSHLDDIELITTLDYRIHEYQRLLTAKWVIRIDPNDNFINVLENVLDNSFDGFLFIAPETGDILYNLTRIFEKRGIPNLGCRSDAIKLTRNKYKTLKTLEKLGFTVPKSMLLSINEETLTIFEKGKSLGIPFVIKPIDGISGIGLRLIHDLTELREGLDVILKESPEPWVLLQEYIKGVNVSVSLISRKEEIFPLTLNYQDINLEREDTEYQGGYLPFEHERKDEIMNVAINIIKKIPGLENYVGIDFVVNENGIYFMEINPRLTTSFIGICTAAPFNVARLIMEPKISSLKKIHFTYRGIAFYSKIKLKIPSWEICHLYLTSPGIPEVIAPPFVMKGEKDSEAVAVIVTLGNNLDDARLYFFRIKAELQGFFEIT